LVFKHKTSKKIAELIYSNNEICVLVWEGSSEGFIFKGNKTKLKAVFQKQSKKKDFVESWLKEQIIEHVTTDYEGIVRNPKEYSDYSAGLWQSEEEFKKLLEELKD